MKWYSNWGQVSRRSARPSGAGTPSGKPRRHTGFEQFVEFLKTGNDPYGESGAHLQEWIGDWDRETFNVKERKKPFEQ